MYPLEFQNAKHRLDIEDEEHQYRIIIATEDNQLFHELHKEIDRVIEKHTQSKNITDVEWLNMNQLNQELKAVQNSKRILDQLNMRIDLEITGPDKKPEEEEQEWLIYKNY